MPPGLTTLQQKKWIKSQKKRSVAEVAAAKVEEGSTKLEPEPEAEAAQAAAVSSGAELRRQAIESGLSFGDIRGKSDGEIRALMHAPKIDSSTRATTTATKNKTRGALLGGLRNGKLEEAVAKMEEDTAELEPEPPAVPASVLARKMARRKLFELRDRRRKSPPKVARLQEKQEASRSGAHTLISSTCTMYPLLKHHHCIDSQETEIWDL